MMRVLSVMHQITQHDLFLISYTSNDTHMIRLLSVMHQITQHDPSLISYRQTDRQNVYSLKSCT